MVAPSGSAASEPSATGAANGKVILLGEHAVVYGSPALSAGIDRGATVEARSSPSPHSVLVLGDRETSADPDGDALARAFHALLAVGPVGPVAVRAVAHLPPGGGLGCSAALGVAIGQAIERLSAQSVDVDPARVLARANAWELVFHGNPSGIDTATAMSGGCLRFTRKDGPQSIQLGADLVLCVGSTGAGSSTHTMVEQVAELRKRRPKVVDNAVSAITSVVENGCLAAKGGDLGGLGRLMDLNQMLLASIMVSTEEIEEMCKAARGAGALGAKLTGAGGGGAVIALIPSVFEGGEPAEADAVLRAWAAIGKTGFATRVSRRSSIKRPREVS